MSDSTPAFHQLLTSYRSRLLTRTVVMGGLAAACLLALVWRLDALRVPVMATLVVGCGGLALLGWWLQRTWQRDWQRASASAVELDRQMDLSGRLMTAAEFEGRDQPPALYPLLMADVSQAMQRAKTRLPSAVNGRSCLFTALLLFLLIWPLPAALLPPLLTPPAHQMPPDAAKSDDPSTSQDQQDTQQDSSKQDQSSGGDSSKSSSGQQPDQSPSSQDKQGSQQQTSSDLPQDGDRGSAKQQDGRQSKPQSGAKQDASSAQQGSSGSKQQQQQGKQGQSGSKSGEQSGDQSAGLQDKQGDAGASDAAGRLEQLMQQGQSPVSDALKADIQQLLKDLSSEMEQLQQQLQEHQEASAPPTGKRTDPDLYSDKESLDRTSGPEVPIHLKTDTAPTTSPRSASGSGEAGDDISDTPPMASAGPVEMGEQFIAESGAARQRVPPEYQPVIEKVTQPPSTQPPEPAP